MCSSDLANVDASVMYRRWKDSKGKDKEYENIIRKQVSASHAEADKDQVVVPLTMEEYCIKAKSRPAASDNIDMTDFYDDDYDIDDEYDDEDEEENEDGEDSEDSGTGKA